MTQETLREAVARIGLNGNAPQFAFSTWWNNLTDSEREYANREPIETREKVFRAGYASALAAMQPEIDRHVGAAIATMSERLRTPSETVLDAGWSGFENAVRKKKPWHEVMASTLHGALTAFQQENGDA